VAITCTSILRILISNVLIDYKFSCDIEEYLCKILFKLKYIDLYTHVKLYLCKFKCSWFTFFSFLLNFVNFKENFVLERKKTWFKENNNRTVFSFKKMKQN
jgi:hypothetical protein